MTHRNRNVNREASLELSLAAVKSLVSDYSLRCRQAEAATIALMRDGFDVEGATKFAGLVGAQMQVRSMERAVQQQAILQATLIALTSALDAEPEEKQVLLVQIHKDLTLAVKHDREIGMTSSK